MKIKTTSLPGLLIVEPAVIEDRRGYMLESYRLQQYEDAGMPGTFVQDNVSRSRRGVLRGLHYQLQDAQAKLVSVISGRVFDVAVDVRRGSPTFRQWYGAELSGENHRQMYIPAGFAHGFCVLSATADCVYKCTAYYDPALERGISWKDPGIAIDWPVRNPILSERDSRNPYLRDMGEADFPAWKPV